VSGDAQFVRDRLEIVDLLHRYAHHADAGDMAAFLGLFDEEAAIDIGMPGVHDKASLAVAMDSRPEPAAGSRTRHVMTNLVFQDQSADSASGAMYFTFLSTGADGVAPLATGEYTFTVRRRDGRWEIQRWRAVVDGVPPAER